MKKPFIYLQRQRGLGDVLWIEPVIRQLTLKYRKVIVISEYNILFKNYPDPNVIFRQTLNWFERMVYKIEEKLCTQIFFIRLDGAYEKNPKIHFLHAYQLKAKVPLTVEYPRIYLSETEEQTFVHLINPFVVLQLDTWSEKNYRQVFGIDWEKIIEYFLERNVDVIQIGKTTLHIPGTKYLNVNTREMISLIRKASLFIGIDSGPSHIAASVATTALVFFGSVNPTYRHFESLFNGFFLQQPCEFAGCYHEIVSVSGPECRLVGDMGIPKCAFHSNDYLITFLDQIFSKSKF